MPEMEDAGFEVPPAPWEYEDGGNDGSDSSSDSQGAGYAEMRDQYNDAGIGAGGSGDSDSGDISGYGQGAGYAAMRDQYNEAGIGAGGTRTYSGYPGMDRGLPPDNAGINFPIDYSPPPGMGTDTDMGNPYEPIPPGTFGSLGSPTPPQRGGGGGSSHHSGPSIPPDVLRQFINLLRYGGLQRI
jgi:hypothetical protein